MKKLAYLPMAVDMIHQGHLNIIKNAVTLDATVMVGCYSDEAIASYKRIPFMKYEQRKLVVESIKGVDIVVQQRTNDLEENIRKYKPDYVVHGTDWQDGALSGARQRTIDILKEWGGVLVEPEYTKGISSTLAHMHLRNIGTMPSVRCARLRKLLALKPALRIIDVHNALSASIVENASIKKSGKPIAEFDCFWLDSYSLAQIKNKKTIQDVDFSEKRALIAEIFDGTTKPLLYDGRPLTELSQIEREVKILEALGVSGIILSNNDNDKLYTMLSTAKKSQLEGDFMVIPEVMLDIIPCNEEAILSHLLTCLSNSGDAILFKSKVINQEVLQNIVVKIRETYKNAYFLLSTSSQNKIQESFFAAGCDAILYENYLSHAVANSIESLTSQILEEA